MSACKECGCEHGCVCDYDVPTNLPAASELAPARGSVATLIKPIVAYGQVFPVGTVIAGLKLSQKDYWCGRLDGYYVSHIPPDYFQCD